MTSKCDFPYNALITNWMHTVDALSFHSSPSKTRGKQTDTNHRSNKYICWRSITTMCFKCICKQSIFAFCSWMHTCIARQFYRGYCSTILVTRTHKHSTICANGFCLSAFLQHFLQHSFNIFFFWIIAVPSFSGEHWKMDVPSGTYSITL